MSSLPPLARKDEKSGLAASMIQPYLVIDWANSMRIRIDDGGYTKLGLLEDEISYLVCRDEGGLTSARMWSGVLRVGPGHREAPLGARGPERIFCTTDAVAVVSSTAVLEQVTAEPTNDCGSKG